MNKILSGLLGLVLVAGLVGGSAYALLSDTASVTGVALGVGSAGLNVRAEGDTVWHETTDLTGLVFANKLIPGRTEWGRFELQNASDDSDTDPIDMNLTGQLVAHSGDWDDLSGVIMCSVYDELAGGTPTGGASTGWKTLAQWASAPVSLPSGALVSGGERTYTIRCMLPTSADDSVAGMSVTGIGFDIVGTQVTPTVDF